MNFIVVVEHLSAILHLQTGRAWRHERRTTHGGKQHHSSHGVEEAAKEPFQRFGHAPEPEKMVKKHLKCAFFLCHSGYSSLFGVQRLSIA